MDLFTFLDSFCLFFFSPLHLILIAFAARVIGFMLFAKAFSILLIKGTQKGLPQVLSESQIPLKHFNTIQICYIIIMYGLHILWWHVDWSAFLWARNSASLRIFFKTVSSRQSVQSGISLYGLGIAHWLMYIIGHIWAFQVDKGRTDRGLW